MKDHLGNVRVVLTEDAIDGYDPPTMETALAANEDLHRGIGFDGLLPKVIASASHTTQAGIFDEQL